MKKKNLIILFTGFVFFLVLASQNNLALAEDGSKIECLLGNGGTLNLAPSINMAPVGEDIILNCMGKTDTFTGDSTINLSGSTGNTSIVTVTPEIMTINVNPDGSTSNAIFIIMSTAPGSTDVAVDFSGAMNFDILSTLWNFQGASTSSGGGLPSSTSSTSSGGISSIIPGAGLPSPIGSSSFPGSSSTGSSSSNSCSAAATTQCKQKPSRKACKACCSSLARSSSDKKCHSKCLKKCKGQKH